MELAEMHINPLTCKFAFCISKSTCEKDKSAARPRKKDAGKESADPALAMPLQKLDQLRNQDSPAKLFRLMEGEKQPAPDKKGKNW